MVKLLATAVLAFTLALFATVGLAAAQTPDQNTNQDTTPGGAPQTGF